MHANAFLFRYATLVDLIQQLLQLHQAPDIQEGYHATGEGGRRIEARLQGGEQLSGRKRAKLLHIGNAQANGQIASQHNHEHRPHPVDAQIFLIDRLRHPAQGHHSVLQVLEAIATWHQIRCRRLPQIPEKHFHFSQIVSEFPDNRRQTQPELVPTIAGNLTESPLYRHSPAAVINCKLYNSNTIDLKY